MLCHINCLNLKKINFLSLNNTVKPDTNNTGENSEYGNKRPS